MSGKETVMEWIRNFPETWSVENVIEALAIRAELRLAEMEIEAGHFITQEEMEQESGKWISP